jgi:hypothetical protein
MAWRTFLALGVVSIGAAAVAGCTAEVKAGGSINDGGPDGAPSGGSSTGGAANTGGSHAGTGGGANTGGSQGGSGGSGTGGGGPTTCDKTVSDRCQKCINTNCCAELNDCNDDRCAGSSTTDGELVCMQTCLQNGFNGLDAGSTSIGDCADKCKGSNAVIAANTNAVISCMVQIGDGSTTQLCSTQCFGGDVSP